MARQIYDDAEHAYVPEASDRVTRYALVDGIDLVEQYANTGDAEDWEAAEDYFRAAADGVLSDLGFV